MAIPAITSTNPAYEQIASGVAYSRTITASNTPTSYAASGLPAGLSMNTSTGEITGSPTATSATAYSVSVTASNGDGTSAAQTWLIVVLASVVGLDAGGFVVPVDFDLYSRKLALPGLGSAQPAERPPGGGGASAPLGTWIEGEKFDLSLGALAAGVLQEVGFTRIKVLWTPDGESTAVSLHADAEDITATGSGTTTRYEVPIYVDPALVRGALSENESITGQRVTGLLQIVAQSSTDASEFSYSSSQTITSLTASDSEAKTFAVTLSSLESTPLQYTVTISLVCPTDTSLNCTVVRNITVHWNAGGSTYVVDTNTGDTNDTGTPTNPAFWSTTLTPTSITATASGISVVGTATTSANAHEGGSIDLAATFGANVAVFEVINDALDIASGPLALTLYSTGPTEIGSIDISDGDTTADIKSALETLLSETVVSVTFENTTTIRIVFDSGTAVIDHDFASEISLGAPSAYPGTLSFANASITCEVVGVEMPELSQTLASQLTPHDIEMTLDV